MRITLESDYALKILTTLAEHCEVTDAKTLSEETAVSLTFTLKILRKLSLGGLVSSHKGAKGGYILKTSPQNISLKDVIELIDGPIAIARCLDEGACALNHDTASCIYHHIFNDISLGVSARLAGITIADVISKASEVK